MCDLEQEHEKLPSTMSLKKSIDMDPGFSFSGDTKTLSCGSEKGNNNNNNSIAFFPKQVGVG